MNAVLAKNIGNTIEDLPPTPHLTQGGKPPRPQPVRRVADTRGINDIVGGVDALFQRAASENPKTTSRAFLGFVSMLIREHKRTA